MKATRLQIVFISDNPKLANTGLGVGSPMTADELALYNALEDARALVQPRVGIPIDFYYLNKYKGNDLPTLEQWKIDRFPAVRVWAQYADGKQAWYNLNQGVLPTTYTGQQIADYITGLYNGDFGKSSILCQILPPLCSIGGWLWLAGAVLSAYKFTQAQTDGQKLLWGAATGLTAQSFFAGGGFKKLGIGQ